VARSERPPWWPLFISLERALGEPLERATRSDEFADLLTKAASLGAWGRAAYEKATADALHRANLPAWSDVRALAEQMTDLERRVGDLALELERRRSGAPRPRSSRRRPRPPDQ
jgi:hypothetical protein